MAMCNCYRRGHGTVNREDGSRVLARAPRDICSTVTSCERDNSLPTPALHGAPRAPEPLPRRQRVNFSTGYRTGTGTYRTLISYDPEALEVAFGNRR